MSTFLLLDLEEGKEGCKGTGFFVFVFLFWFACCLVLFFVKVIKSQVI